MITYFTRSIAVLLACICVVGCSTGDNPKMPNIEPQKITVDTSVPKNRGGGGAPYGASKKYQDMMNNRQ